MFAAREAGKYFSSINTQQKKNKAKNDSIIIKSAAAQFLAVDF
jgi:hypothetical protein